MKCSNVVECVLLVCVLCSISIQPSLQLVDILDILFYTFVGATDIVFGL